MPVGDRAEREVRRETRDLARSEAGERRAEARLRDAARIEARIVARELDLSHLDADALPEEVAERARQPDGDARGRRPHEERAADDQLEPALRLDQVLGHDRRQSRDARGIELRGEIREVDAVRHGHDALEDAARGRTRRLRRGEHRAGAPRRAAVRSTPNASGVNETSASTKSASGHARTDGGGSRRAAFPARRVTSAATAHEPASGGSGGAWGASTSISTALAPVVAANARTSARGRAPSRPFTQTSTSRACVVDSRARDQLAAAAASVRPSAARRRDTGSRA
jgi:hypothetical protein